MSFIIVEEEAWPDVAWTPLQSQQHHGTKETTNQEVKEPQGDLPSLTPQFNFLCQVTDWGLWVQKPLKFSRRTQRSPDVSKVGPSTAWDSPLVLATSFAALCLIECYFLSVVQNQGPDFWSTDCEETDLDKWKCAEMCLAVQARFPSLHQKFNHGMTEWFGLEG